MKYQKHEIQVSGNRVLVKQYQDLNKKFFNWVEIARFSFHNGVGIDPSEEAKKYAESISI